MSLNDGRSPRSVEGSDAVRTLRLRPADLWGGSTSAFSNVDFVVEDVLGYPAVVVVEGTSDEWDALADTNLERVRRDLSWLPALSVAIVLGDGTSSGRPIVASFDLIAQVGGTSDGSACNIVGSELEVRTAVDTWMAGVSSAPEASVLGAMLARAAADGTVEEALRQESLVYSLLQRSLQHRAWLDERGPVLQPSSTESTVIAREAGTHTEVVLSRVERHNALNMTMRDDLTEILVGLQARDQSPIVIRGAGPSFCSGGDLAEFGTVPGAIEGHLVRIARSPARCFHKLSHRLVVGLHGACVGAGIELAAFAEHVVAASDATMWLPEASIGLVPGAGGSVSISRRAGRHRLVELLVTGRRIDAWTAHAWGLVDEVVPPDELITALERRARMHFQALC